MSPQHHERPEAGDPCPGCGTPLEGFATKCWAGDVGCGWRWSPSESPRGLDSERRSQGVLDTRSEKAIQHAIKQALQSAGFRVWDTSQPHKAAITPGLPDLIFAGHGVVAFCEVKGPKGRATPAQAEFLELVGENGGLALLWRDEGEAIEWIESVMGRTAA